MLLRGWSSVVKIANLTKTLFRLAVAHHCTRSGGKEEVMLINVLTNEQKNLICPPSHQNRVFNPDSQHHKNSLGKILLHDGKVNFFLYQFICLNIIFGVPPFCYLFFISVSEHFFFTFHLIFSIAILIPSLFLLNTVYNSFISSDQL